MAVRYKLSTVVEVVDRRGGGRAVLEYSTQSDDEQLARMGVARL